MLDIQNLTKRYGKFLAVDNLNLHIDKGEIFGFVGPNGAGKTTTMKIVCGLLAATGGNVTVDGVDALRNPDDIKRKVGYVPDFFGVYDNLKVMEYMEFFGSMYGMSREDVDGISDGLLELVNLSDKKDFFVDTLSRGMKQRLCVARALIHNPELLVLDEPNSGLDPRARFEMKEVLKNLGAMGKTIIISSHILPELSEMCTSIGIMDHGHLVTSGHVDEIMSSSGSAAKLHIRFADWNTGSMDEAVNIEENVIGTESGYERDSVTAVESGNENDTVTAVGSGNEKESITTVGLGNENESVIAVESAKEKNNGDFGKIGLEDKKDRIRRLLMEQPNVRKVNFTEDEVLVSFTGDEKASSVLLKNLIEQNFAVSGFYKEKEDLETLFLEITGEHGNSNSYSGSNMNSANGGSNADNRDGGIKA